MGDVLRKEACPQCVENGNDNSGDNLVRYTDQSAHCFACGYNEHTKKQRSNMVTQELVKTDKPKITEEQNSQIKASTTFSIEYRGIRKETHKFFGVRYEMQDGQPVKQYCPTTIKNTLSGYKPRTLPKTFGGSIGLTGMECDLFGQFRFKSSKSRDCLIVGGEIDALSAYQMLRDYQISRGNGEYDAVAVVSPTVGESGCGKQIQAQYKFFDKFERIIVGFDNDEAGKEGVEKIIPLLPKGKVYIAEWTKKDPNEYLTENETKRFISDFYSAKKYIPAGVVGSGDLYEKLIEKVCIPKIDLPPFMQKLDNMIGNIELGSIGLLAAGTGAAKTTFANELIYYWLFNSPYKVGVVTLELDAGSYAQAMLSRHVETKISNMMSIEEKLDFLSREDIKQKAEELFKINKSEDRWMLIDERDGSLEQIKEKIEELIISCGCRIIILDPVSDLLDGVTIDDQAVFMKWMKSMTKNYNVTFLLIAHIRKSANNQQAASTGAFIPEESVIGSSTLIKSASFVVMMMRDKYNEDEIVRNTTTLVLSKNRNNGVTGECGKIYYCNKTHRLHDIQEYFPNGVPERVDW